MAIKSIRPISPTATSMPSKAVAPLGSPSPKAPIGQVAGIRDHFYPSSGLPAIGDVKRKQDALPKLEQGGRLSDKVPYAFQPMAKFMPSAMVNRGAKKFDSAYISGFSSYNDFFGGLQADFGAGALKTYQTPTGTQNLYDYQYQNLLRYGDIRGPQVTNQFVFRDGRFWQTQERVLNPNYEKIVEGATNPLVSRFNLTDSETTALYHLALKNGLTQEQYANLYKSVSAKKFFSMTDELATSFEKSRSSMESEIKPYYDSIANGTQCYSPGISNHAQWGSIYGDGDPGIKFLRELPQMYKTFKNAPALSFQFSTGQSGWENLIANVNSLISIFTFGFDFGGTGMWLTNQSGKIIDRYEDVDSTGNVRAIKRFHQSSGIDRDDIAAVLGAFYRWRIMKVAQPLIDRYNKFYATKDEIMRAREAGVSYYSSAVIPEFESSI